jgi:hypothetical protein
VESVFYEVSRRTAKLIGSARRAKLYLGKSGLAKSVQLARYRRRIGPVFPQIGSTQEERRMKKLPAALVSAGAAVSIMVGAAFAQTAAPNPAPVDRKALAKECSKQADAKGLRGKPRKRFRDACKRGQTGEAPKPVS